MLSDSDRTWMESRRRLTRTWTPVGILLVILLLGGAALAARTAPLLFNPLAVTARLREGRMDPRTLELMAAMLPIVMLMCLAIALAVIVLAFVAFRGERRYLRIIAALLESPAFQEDPAPSKAQIPTPRNREIPDATERVPPGP